MAQVTTTAHEAWAHARAKKTISKCSSPTLERIVDLRRQYADCFQPYDHIYDPLLDDFERGMKTADVQAIFGALRPQQVALIQAISQRPQVEMAFCI
jgi:carboxypeptidase Taq